MRAPSVFLLDIANLLQFNTGRQLIEFFDTLPLQVIGNRLCHFDHRI